MMLDLADKLMTQDTRTYLRITNVCDGAHLGAVRDGNRRRVGRRANRKEDVNLESIDQSRRVAFDGPDVKCDVLSFSPTVVSKLCIKRSHPLFRYGSRGLAAQRAGRAAGRGPRESMMRPAPSIRSLHTFRLGCCSILLFRVRSLIHISIDNNVGISRSSVRYSNLSEMSVLFFVCIRRLVWAMALSSLTIPPNVSLEACVGLVNDSFSVRRMTALGRTEPFTDCKRGERSSVSVTL